MRNIRSHDRLRTVDSYFSQSDYANLRRSVGSLGECRIERDMLQEASHHTSSPSSNLIKLSQLLAS